MTALAGATRVQIGPFRELRMKRPRHVELRIIMTALAGPTQVLMGPFRQLRMKRDTRLVDIRMKSDTRLVE